MSEGIGELVKALAVAKAQMKPPKKGRTAQAGKYQYNYADRADVIESYSSALAANGLQISHSITLTDGLHTILVSKLLHTSGAFLESSVPIPASDNAQTLGSWLTYMSRYQSCCLLDIAAEDDDDGARAVTPKREEHGDPEQLQFYDLRVAVMDAAKELELKTGGIWQEHVKKASSFMGKDRQGKPKRQEFGDPMAASVTSERWLKTTHGKLIAELEKAEPGAAEGAELLK